MQPPGYLHGPGYGAGAAPRGPPKSFYSSGPLSHAGGAQCSGSLSLAGGAQYSGPLSHAGGAQYDFPADPGMPGSTEELLLQWSAVACHLP